MTTTGAAPADVAGLSASEVADRVAAGKTNDVPNPTSRSYVEIVKANIFTRFNALLGALLVAILAVREYKDALFGIVLVLNAAIGIIQEIRAKRTLDRLTLLSAPTVAVRRDGGRTEIPTARVVLDDVVDLSLGDQVTVDGVVLEAAGLEIDESLLTGEADPVVKQPGDEVQSGSFCVAGTGTFRATAVGRDSYAYRINEDASRFSLVRSELRDGINTILKYVTWLILPVGILLVVAQVRAGHGGDVHGFERVREVVQGSVAGMVAMVPEGLVLLTSMAMALAVLRLGRSNVLVQELPAVEGLARVDVLCVDKTGTLTQGSLALGSIEVLAGVASDDDDDSGGGGGGGEDLAGTVLAAMAAADPTPNPSMVAVKEACGVDPAWTTTGAVPFSSARKWSATAFDGRGAWFFGAPDILVTRAADPAATMARVDGFAAEGRRVLLLARAPGGLTGEVLPDVVEPVALVVLEEQLRPDAPDTIAFFRRQGVHVKVISGDNPTTVGAVASRCGIPGADQPVDARQLPTDQDELADALEASSVFGRVTPQQKRAMVHALQSKGHSVAMTGDGVNDTLALKDAEIGVAMGAGSAAARAVARVVLLDNSFAVFPSVVAEGRRVIANVERVANLFVTKTVYAMLLSLAIGVMGWAFPFVPRQLTIISGLTIGIPAFFLALAPNPRRAMPGFLRRVLRFAAPAGLVAATCTFTTYALVRSTASTGDPVAEARTAATITLFGVAIWVLTILCRPLRAWKVGLIAAMVGLFVGALTIPFFRNYFALEVLPASELVEALVVALIGAVALEIATRAFGLIDHELGLDGVEGFDPIDDGGDQVGTAAP